MTNATRPVLNLIFDVRNVLQEKSLPANVTYTLNLEASVAVSTISFLTFIILCLLLILYYRGDDQVGNCGSPNNSILLFLGIVINIVTVLSIPKYDANIYRVYIILLLILVGIVVTIAGSFFFFEVPNRNENPLSYNHENISVVIWLITIPLAVMELLEFIGSIAYKVEDYEYKTAVNVLAIIQKITQASLYHFSLRHKMADKNKREGASWYLRIISLFNFATWLDSMIMRSEGNIKKIFGQGFSILNTANVALLIDYRLLCCLLFAEHSMEIFEEESAEEGDAKDKTIVVPDEREFKIRASQMSGLGFMFGFTILALQLVSGLQNYSVVGAWSNIFSIFADVFVVALGLALLSLDHLPNSILVGKWRKSDAKGIDLMVAMMGIVGLLYWIIMAIFNGAWIRKVPLSDDSISYLKWSCAKNVVRSVGIVFQLYVFIKCDSRFGSRECVKGKMGKYFIMPALLFSFLSVFVMAIMDGHSEIVEVLIESSSISTILITLMKVSEPLYLGYCLHLFLHFFIVYNNVRSLKVRQTTTESPEEAVPMNPLVT